MKHHVETKKGTDRTDKHVGSKVRMGRLLLNMTQEQLGDALGLTFQQVQKYEKGTNRIGASRLKQISTILHVPVDFFFEGEPNDPRSPKNDTIVPARQIIDFMTTAEGLATAKAMLRISEPALRLQFVHLLEAVAHHCGVEEASETDVADERRRGRL